MPGGSTGIRTSDYKAAVDFYTPIFRALGMKVTDEGTWTNFGGVVAVRPDTASSENVEILLRATAREDVDLALTAAVANGGTPAVAAHDDGDTRWGSVFDPARANTVYISFSQGA